jgi:hypothetical protein
LVPPDADFDHLFGWIRDQMKLNVFMQRHLRQIDLVVEQGDSAVAIDGSGFSQAEDVFGGSVRFGKREAAEETIARLFGVGEANGGDLAGGGMDLVIIVAMDFIVQDGASVSQGGDVFECAGADNSILEPVSISGKSQKIIEIKSPPNIAYALMGSVTFGVNRRRQLC